MKIWIVYDSKFGNNKRIAEYLAELFKEGNDVRVFYAKKIAPRKILDEGIDMLLFGGPLRAGNISFTIKGWANKVAKELKKRQTQVKIVAVWGSHSAITSGVPNKFSWENSKEKWNLLLRSFPAEKKTQEVVGFPVNPNSLEGPLEAGWEDLAKKLSDLVKAL